MLCMYLFVAAAAAAAAAHDKLLLLQPLETGPQACAK
jgi:hypothetical protein